MSGNKGNGDYSPISRGEPSPTRANTTFHASSAYPGAGHGRTGFRMSDMETPARN